LLLYSTHVEYGPATLRSTTKNGRFLHGKQYALSNAAINFKYGWFTNTQEEYWRTLP